MFQFPGSPSPHLSLWFSASTRVIPGGTELERSPGSEICLQTPEKLFLQNTFFLTLTAKITSHVSFNFLDHYKPPKQSGYTETDLFAENSAMNSAKFYA